jgi:Flp pilus assembly pilin Flp
MAMHVHRLPYTQLQKPANLQFSRGLQMKEMMLTLYANLRRLMNEEDGQDLVEYSLLIAVVVLFCCAAVDTVAGTIRDLVFADAAGVLTTYSK